MGRAVFIFAALLFLTACSGEASIRTLNDPSPDQILPSNSGGLSLKLGADRFNSSPTVLETTVRNDSELDYEHGAYYYIEVKKDGKWYTLVHSDAVFLNNPQLTDFGLLLQAGSEIDQRFSIEMLEVELPPGEYRLVKTFLSREQPFYERSLAAPFTVKE